MRGFTVLLCAALAGGPAGADDNLAAELDQLGAMNKGCEVSVVGYASLLSKPGGQPSDIWLHTIEGCAGGNNWLTVVTGFQAKDTAAKPMVGQQLTVARINNWSVTWDSNAPTQYLTLDASTWGEPYVHCCPQVRQTIRVWAENNELKWKVMSSKIDPDALKDQ